MLRKLSIIIVAIIAPFYTAQAKCINLGSNTCGPATSYEIKIKKVEFCKSSACSSSFVVSSSSADFDISDAAAGGAVGNYADLDSVPAGIYTHVQTTIDGNITYSAPILNTCSAQTNASLNVVTGIGGIGSALSSDPDFNLTISGSDLNHLYELSRPLIITKAGSLPQVQIDFSTADGHICNSGASYPGIPYVDIQVFNN